MVFFDKSQPAPAELSDEKAKPSGTYNIPEVLERLRFDFKDKCYICEWKGIFNINIEHFRPHRGNLDLMFDWNNLFWSCSHCNSIKSDKYENLINCTLVDTDISDRIRLSMKVMPKESVIVEALCNDAATIESKKLLEAVYGGTSVRNGMQAKSLRDQILKELSCFHRLLEDYYFAEDDTEDKIYFRTRIVSSLRRSAPFTSFKRSIILSSADFSEEFQREFD